MIIVSISYFQSSLRHCTWGKKKACQYCKLFFAPPFLLTSSLPHIKGGAAHHCELEMYVCDLCNRRFSTQGNLKRH